MNAQMLEESLLGAGSVVHLERDAWSVVRRLLVRQAIHQYPRVLPPPPPYHPPLFRLHREHGLSRVRKVEAAETDVVTDQLSREGVEILTGTARYIWSI